MTDPVHTITLASHLDMNAAAPLANDLRSARGRPVALDAAGARRVGGQCLQVLLSARDAWAEDGFAFGVANASPEFTESLTALGCPDFPASAIDED